MKHLSLQFLFIFLPPHVFKADPKRFRVVGQISNLFKHALMFDNMRYKKLNTIVQQRVWQLLNDDDILFEACVKHHAVFGNAHSWQ